MDTKKAFLLTAHLIILFYAAFNLLFLLRADVILAQFKDQDVGKYSIYNDKAIFLAYHAWGIIVPLVCSYALWKNLRMLFFISLTLLILVMFYPWLTA